MSIDETVRRERVNAEALRYERVKAAGKAKPETLGEARKWTTALGHYLHDGLCHGCAAQAAYGHQNGFSTIRPPCEECAPIVAGFPVPAGVGSPWRKFPRGSSRARSAHESSRHARPVPPSGFPGTETPANPGTVTHGATSWRARAPGGTVTRQPVEPDDARTVALERWRGPAQAYPTHVPAHTVEAIGTIAPATLGLGTVLDRRVVPAALLTLSRATMLPLRLVDMRRPDDPRAVPHRGRVLVTHHRPSAPAAQAERLEARLEVRRARGR